LLEVTKAHDLLEVNRLRGVLGEMRSPSAGEVGGLVNFSHGKSQDVSAQVAALEDAF